MSITLEVEPETALIDVPRRIVVSGLRDGEIVEIASESTHSDGSVWRATAQFPATADGVVDVATQSPIDGSYQGVSAMGLVWSQIEVSPPDGRPRERASVVAPRVVKLVASSRDGMSVAHASFKQLYVPEGVVRREILEDGLSGVLFLPAGPGPHIAIMIMNGSGGGINEPRAALYASRGYAALALGYFRCPGRPDYISNTPLEYFQKGLGWIRKNVRPMHDFVAISGQSRGGELVLLLASMFPDEVSAVMAYVPAAYIHSGQSAADPALGRESATWTLDGKPLPHLWENNRTGAWAPYDAGPTPKRLEYALLTALADHRATERARIPVEKIKCPILLIHGTDDGWWPTDYHCDVIEETLAAVAHSPPVTRLRFPGAGHLIVFPHVPTTTICQAHAISGILSTNGGNARDNAVANEEAWAGALKFLENVIAAKSRLAPAEGALPR